MEARRAAEQAARNSYGRLIAYLSVRTQDVATAEDALGEAFLTALQTWPTKGVPTNPEAWLLVTARRKLIDQSRRSQTKRKALNLLNLSGFDNPDAVSDAFSFPDNRLQLLFVCAHPAIKPSLHTPLMLQTVLGLNAEQIGSAFLVASATMGQRLVRIKAKIKTASIPFELPNSQALPTRLQAVLQAIYAAYSAGWDSAEDTATGSDQRMTGLSQEAILLAKLCVQLMPNEPEAHGLLALMLYCDSRQNARRIDGQYIPLSEQDATLWSQPLITQAETALKQAASHNAPGRFQLEAAIQSVHAQRAISHTTKTTDWQTLTQLYEGLIQISPTVGAVLGKAAAIAQTQTPTDALNLLNALPIKTVQNHQPYWALKAHLLSQTDQINDAQSAYTQAIGLTEDVAVRSFLLAQAAALKT